MEEPKKPGRLVSLFVFLSLMFCGFLVAGTMTIIISLRSQLDELHESYEQGWGRGLEMGLTDGKGWREGDKLGKVITETEIKYLSKMLHDAHSIAATTERSEE